MTAGEIADHFHLKASSTISPPRSVATGRSCELPEKGNFVIYSIETSVIDEVLKWMMGIAINKKRNKTKTKPTLS